MNRLLRVFLLTIIFYTIIIIPLSATITEEDVIGNIRSRLGNKEYMKQTMANSLFSMFKDWSSELGELFAKFPKMGDGGKCLPVLAAMSGEIIRSYETKGVTKEMFAPLVDFIHGKATDMVIDGVVDSGLGLLSGGVLLANKLLVLEFTWLLTEFMNEKVTTFINKSLDLAQKKKGDIKVEDLMGYSVMQVAELIWNDQQSYPRPKKDGKQIKDEQYVIAWNLCVKCCKEIKTFYIQIKEEQKRIRALWLEEMKILDRIKLRTGIVEREFPKEFEKDFESLAYWKFLLELLKTDSCVKSEMDMIREKALKFYRWWKIAEYFQMRDKAAEGKSNYEALLSNIKSKSQLRTELFTCIEKIKNKVTEEGKNILYELGRAKYIDEYCSDKGELSAAPIREIASSVEELKKEESNKKEMDEAVAKPSFSEEELNTILEKGKTLPKSAAEKVQQSVQPEKMVVKDTATYAQYIEEFKTNMKNDFSLLSGSPSLRTAEGLKDYYEKQINKTIPAIFTNLALNMFYVEEEYTHTAQQFVQEGPIYNDYKDKDGTTKQILVGYSKSYYIDMPKRVKRQVYHSFNAEKALSDDAYLNETMDATREAAREKFNNTSETERNSGLVISATAPYIDLLEEAKTLHKELDKLYQDIKIKAENSKDKLQSIFTINVNNFELDEMVKKVFEKMIQEVQHRKNLFEKSLVKIKELVSKLGIDKYLTDNVLPLPKDQCFLKVQGFNEKQSKALETRTYVSNMVCLYPRFNVKSSVEDQLEGIKDNTVLFNNYMDSLKTNVDSYSDLVMGELGNLDYSKKEEVRKAIVLLDAEILKLENFNKTVKQKNDEISGMAGKLNEVRDGDLKNLIEYSQELVLSTAKSSGVTMGYDSIMDLKSDKNGAFYEDKDSKDGYFVRVKMEEGKETDGEGFGKWLVKTELNKIIEQNNKIEIKKGEHKAIQPGLCTTHLEQENFYVYTQEVQLKKSALLEMLPLAIAEQNSVLLKKLPELLSGIEQVRQGVIFMSYLSTIYNSYHELIDNEIQQLRAQKDQFESWLEDEELIEELESIKEQYEEQYEKDEKTNYEGISESQSYSEQERMMNDDEVMNAAKEKTVAILESYENGDVSGMMRYISDDFRSNFSQARNYSLLEQSVSEDMRNLRNIQFSIYFNGNPVIYREQNRVRVFFTWTRRSEIARTGEEWILETKNSDFVYSVNSEKKLKLVEIERDIPFGLTGEFGTLEISEGKFVDQDGNITPVERKITIENGRAKNTSEQLPSPSEISGVGEEEDTPYTAETTYTPITTPVSSTSVQNAAIIGFGWSFDSLSEVPLEQSDFYWENNDPVFCFCSDNYGLLDLTSNYGYTSLTDIKEKPDSGGYTDYMELEGGRKILAVKTTTGKIAIIQINGYTSERMYFDYVIFD